LGWASVPPGTRKSTYENPEYQKAAPFAQATLKAMETADPSNPCIKKVPYTGITFVGIPEFQSLSDSKLNATESPKLFATEKKSRDIIVLLLE